MIQYGSSGSPLGGGGEGGSKPGKGVPVGPLWGEGRGRQQAREGGTRGSPLGGGEREAASRGRGHPWVPSGGRGRGRQQAREGGSPLGGGGERGSKLWMGAPVGPLWGEGGSKPGKGGPL